MFAAIPKIADKTFVVAYLLPVILFAAVNLAFFRDTDAAQDILEKISGDEKDLQKVAYIAFVLWGASIALMILNQIVFKIIEGYHMPAFLAKWRLARQIETHDLVEDRINEIRRLFDEAPDAFTPGHEVEHDRLLLRLVKQFPERGRLLPTSFGNAIRAFEDYSRTVYGADAIPLWIHLSTVMPKEYGATVEEARAHVSFYMNTFVFALAMALIAFGQLCVQGLWPVFRGAQTSVSWAELSALGWVAASLVIARLAYGLALERIYSWGALVKAGFDCYLPELAGKLGYSLPATSREQKLFWQEVSRRAIYHKPLIAESWPRVASQKSGKSSQGNETTDNADGADDDNE